MLTPLELLEKELSILLFIANMARHPKKKKAKILIPIYEHAISKLK